VVFGIEDDEALVFAEFTPTVSDDGKKLFLVAVFVV